jgi:chromosome segregation ATPase
MLQNAVCDRGWRPEKSAQKSALLFGTNRRDARMPKKLQSDDDDLMKIFERYAELRREHTEYQDTVHTLECDIASLQGRVDELEELNKQLTEERDRPAGHAIRADGRLVRSRAS